MGRRGALDCRLRGHPNLDGGAFPSHHNWVPRATVNPRPPSETRVGVEGQELVPLGRWGNWGLE